MAKTFSFSTFFRMVPHSLLKQLFHFFHIDTSLIPWEMLKSKEIDVFFNLFHELSQQKQDRLESVCRDVFTLACTTGLNVLCETAEMENESGWFALSHEKSNPYAKSLWSWLNYPDVFQKALEFHKLENVSWWRKRDGLPCVVPDWNNDIKQSLERALQDFFTNKQGRGQICTVEMQKHHASVFYFIARPDDYLQKVLQHDAHGELVARKTRPTFEVIFAYNSREGTLELHVKGGEKTKCALEEIFIETILSGKAPAYQRPVYDLSMFKDPGFSLTTDPEDRVLVQIKQMRIHWQSDGRILFRNDKQVNFMNWIRERINEERLLLDQGDIEYIKLQFLFLSTDTGRKSSLTLDINTPNRSTLRSKDTRKVEIIQKYLKRWGIEHERIIENTADTLRL